MLAHLGTVALKLGLSLGALLALCAPRPPLGPDTNPDLLRLALLVLDTPSSPANGSSP